MNYDLSLANRRRVGDDKVAGYGYGYGSSYSSDRDYATHLPHSGTSQPSAQNMMATSKYMYDAYSMPRASSLTSSLEGARAGNAANGYSSLHQQVDAGEPTAQSSSNKTVVSALQREVADLHKRLTIKDLDLVLANEAVSTQCRHINMLEAEVRRLEKVQSMINTETDKRNIADQEAAAKQEAKSEVELARLHSKIRDMAEDFQRKSQKQEESNRLQLNELMLARDTSIEKVSHENKSLRDHIAVLEHRGEQLRSRNESLLTEVSTLKRESADLQQTLESAELDAKEAREALLNYQQSSSRTLETADSARKRASLSIRYLCDEHGLGLARLEALQRSLVEELYAGTVVPLLKAQHESLSALYVAEFRGRVKAQTAAETVSAKEKAEASERADLMEAKYKDTMALFLHHVYGPIYRQAVAQPAAMARSQHNRITEAKREQARALDAQSAKFGELLRYLASVMEERLVTSVALLAQHHSKVGILYADSVSLLSERTRGTETWLTGRGNEHTVVNAMPKNFEADGVLHYDVRGSEGVVTDPLRRRLEPGGGRDGERLFRPTRSASVQHELDASFHRTASQTGGGILVAGRSSLPLQPSSMGLSRAARSGSVGPGGTRQKGFDPASDSNVGWASLPHNNMGASSQGQHWHSLPSARLEEPHTTASSAAHHSYGGLNSSKVIGNNHPHLHVPTDTYPFFSTPNNNTNNLAAAALSFSSSTALDAHTQLSATLVQYHRDFLASLEDGAALLRRRALDEALAAKSAGAFMNKTSSLPRSAFSSLSLELSPFERNGFIADRCFSLFLSLERITAAFSANSPNNGDADGPTPEPRALSFFSSVLLSKSSAQAQEEQSVPTKAKALAISAILGDFWLELHAEDGRRMLDDHVSFLGTLHGYLSHRQPHGTSQALVALTNGRAAYGPVRKNSVAGSTAEVAHNYYGVAATASTLSGSRLQHQAGEAAIAVLEAQRDQATVVTEWLRQEVAAASDLLKEVLQTHSEEVIASKEGTVKKGIESRKGRRSRHNARSRAHSEYARRAAMDATMQRRGHRYEDDDTEDENENADIDSADKAIDFLRIVEASEKNMANPAQHAHSLRKIKRVTKSASSFYKAQNDGGVAVRDGGAHDVSSELVTPSLQLALPADYSEHIVMPKEGKSGIQHSDDDDGAILICVPPSLEYHFDFNTHCDAMIESLQKEGENIDQIAEAQRELAEMTRLLGVTADEYASTLQSASANFAEERELSAGVVVELHAQLLTERTAHAQIAQQHKKERTELVSSIVDMRRLVQEYRSLACTGRDALWVTGQRKGGGSERGPRATNDDTPSFDDDEDSVGISYSVEHDYSKAAAGTASASPLSSFPLSARLRPLRDRLSDVGLTHSGGGSYIHNDEVFDPNLSLWEAFASRSPFSKHRHGHRRVPALAVESALEEHVLVGSVLLFSYTDFVGALVAAERAERSAISAAAESEDYHNSMRRSEVQAQLASEEADRVRSQALCAVDDLAQLHRDVCIDMYESLGNIVLLSWKPTLISAFQRADSLAAVTERQLQEVEIYTQKEKELNAEIKDKDRRIVLLSTQLNEMAERNWASGSEVASLKSEIDLRQATIDGLEQRLEIVQRVLDCEKEANSQSLAARQLLLEELSSSQKYASELSDKKRELSVERVRDKMSHHLTLQYLLEASNFVEGGDCGGGRAQIRVAEVSSFGARADANKNNFSHLFSSNVQEDVPPMEKEIEKTHAITAVPQTNGRNRDEDGVLTHTAAKRYAYYQTSDEDQRVHVENMREEYDAEGNFGSESAREKGTRRCSSGLLSGRVDYDGGSSSPTKVGGDWPSGQGTPANISAIRKSAVASPSVYLSYPSDRLI